MSLGEMLRTELKKDEKEKKTISVVLENAKLEDIDRIIKGFSNLNPERTFTRQKLIEMAVDNLIEESMAILEEHGLTGNLSASEEEEAYHTERPFDTAIFAAQEEGFNQVFLGENQWYHVRLGQGKGEKLKYVACYVGAPVSAITHYAKVKSIVPEMVDGKQRFRILFDGTAIKLDNPVLLGNISAATVRSNRYVMLDELKAARKYADLM